MKHKTLLIFLLLGIVVAWNVNSAYATSYFVYDHFGGTWHDAEKTLSNEDDDLMCWAAAASNILDWTGWGYAFGESFSDHDDMFAYFQEYWSDQGGTMEFGWDWWFDGSNPAQGANDPLDDQPGWSQVDEEGGGGFWDPPYSFSDYFHKTYQANFAMDAIVEYINSGFGTTISIVAPGIAHALTVWGYEYHNGGGGYYTIWVTDSDDDKDTDNPPDVLAYYDVTFSGSAWDLQEFSVKGSDDWYIAEVQALERSPVPDPVPEPATLFLVGSGLIGLGAFGRRLKNKGRCS